MLEKQGNDGKIFKVATDSIVTKPWVEAEKEKRKEKKKKAKNFYFFLIFTKLYLFESYNEQCYLSI